MNRATEDLTPQERQQLIVNRGEKLDDHAERLEGVETHIKRGQQAALVWSLVVLAVIFIVGVVAVVIITLRSDDGADAVVTISLAAFGVIGSVASFIAGRISRDSK